LKAVHLTSLKRLEVVETAEPRMQRDDEVLLRVDVVGVCGSDVHTYQEGRIGGTKVTYPWILGHECAATVLAAGPEAKGLKVGRRVAVDPLIPCNRCDQCLAGRKHTCRNQKFLASPGQAPGAMVEQLVMPAECCHPIPDSVTTVQAALAEPLSIGLHARNLAALRGGTAAILGSGPIGLCVLLALKEAGATRVFMTDLIDSRLELARRLGAEWTHRGDRDNVLAQAEKAAPQGMDAVFECAGKQETIDQGIAMLAPGGTLVLVGIPAEDRISLDIHVARRRELMLQNVRRQNLCLAPALELVAKGKICVDPLATHHFDLDEAQQAFQTVAEYRDGVVKAMIHVNKQKLH
jgi:L-iditol 2-dehydrogenase